FKRALELNANLSEAHFRYAQSLPAMGRFSEALAEIKRAQELDPLRVPLLSHQASILFFARRYDEAIQQLQNVIKLDPNYGVALNYLGYTYSAKGMYKEAIESFQKQIKVDGETTSTQCYLGYALARSGRSSEAEAILQKLKTTKEYVSPAELAVIYAGLDDKEGAIASLEKAYSDHDLQMRFLKIDPHYDTLRSDPRFNELLRK